MFVGGALTAYSLFSHVQTRVDGWIDPFADTDRFGQIVQGLYGMAWGGLVGRGLGQGEPWRIPFSYSDFIIAAVAEELGLTGIIALILLFGLVVERALRTALICRDGFGKLMAAGLGIAFALQVFVVAGGVTRLIPLTGLTTPFMSYGGSSLVANWVLVALLLRISDHARRPAPASEPMAQDDKTEVVVLR
jgi:cell division protein FtsW (lipid II flippase)